MTFLMDTFARADLRIVRGQGAYLYDDQGRQYLDLASGIAVNALGHGHPALVEALARQSHKLWHASNLYRLPEQEALAERLASLSFADKVFFTNSGAESVEAALKTARRYHHVRGKPERHRFITFANAFHGRTLATASATDQAKVRDGFEPLLDWFDIVPFNDFAAVEAAVDDRTAGILVEPIQGEGGVVAASSEFLAGLRALCDTKDLILIFDEVQTGVGRTGRMFAYEHYGIEPDVMALAKGLGGGFPLGACLASERAAVGMTTGVHGSTYGGNPLACAIGLTVLEQVARPAFLAHVRDVGEMMKQMLTRLAARFPMLFARVRGEGLLLGLEAHIPSRDFVNHARGHGVMTVAAGGDVLRILPPLNITPDQISEAEAKLNLAAQAWMDERATIHEAVRL